MTPAATDIVVVRAGALNWLWAAMAACMAPVAYLATLVLDDSPSWWWLAAASWVLLAALILRRRVIVTQGVVIVQGALRRRVVPIHRVTGVETVGYDGIWGGGSWPWADLVNPFAYLYSPCLMLTVSGDADEDPDLELRLLAGLPRAASNRASLLYVAIAARQSSPPPVVPGR